MISQPLVAICEWALSCSSMIFDSFSSLVFHIASYTSLQSKLHAISWFVIHLFPKISCLTWKMLHLVQLLAEHGHMIRLRLLKGLQTACPNRRHLYVTVSSHTVHLTYKKFLLFHFVSRQEFDTVLFCTRHDNGECHPILSLMCPNRIHEHLPRMSALLPPSGN